MSDIIFDCKICDRCLNAMTAKQYWDHNCQKGEIAMAKDTTEERVAELESELEDLRYELEDNQRDQEELRAFERGFEERIEEIENELDTIEDEDEV